MIADFKAGALKAVLVVTIIGTLVLTLLIWAIGSSRETNQSQDSLRATCESNISDMGYKPEAGQRYQDLVDTCIATGDSSP